MGRRKRFNVGSEKLHIWAELIWMVNWRTMVSKSVWRPIFESVYWWVMESRNESHKVLEMVLIYHYVLHAWHCIRSLMETSSCSLSTLTMKLSKTLWGFLAWKPFSPLFLDFCLYDLPWVLKNRFKWLLIWEWRGWTDRGDGGAATETVVQPWVRVWFHLKGYT